MEIKITKGRAVQFESPQQVWEGCNNIQFSQFAGHDMLAITDDDGGFVLTFLGMTVVEPYTTMDAAKEAAPKFAIKVLEQLSSMVGQ
ncbi:hypothetical protein [Vibrio parahaemolyticus]|uniref:hypothetical protein n=1 Tax=Vibrio parahaemolyticus TaxID=670 RepID=UPI0023EC1584|nr:hypothetical protein [Vibrio parahaemolyticus]